MRRAVFAGSMVSNGCGRPARFVTRSINSGGIESLCTGNSPFFATIGLSYHSTAPSGTQNSFRLDENMGEACIKFAPPVLPNRYTVCDPRKNRMPEIDTFGKFGTTKAEFPLRPKSPDTSCPSWHTWLPRQGDAPHT